MRSGLVLVVLLAAACGSEPRGVPSLWGYSPGQVRSELPPEIPCFPPPPVDSSSPFAAFERPGALWMGDTLDLRQCVPDPGLTLWLARDTVFSVRWTRVTRRAEREEPMAFWDEWAGDMARRGFGGGPDSTRLAPITGTGRYAVLADWPRTDDPRTSRQAIAFRYGSRGWLYLLLVGCVLPEVRCGS